jgi:hypothetical protein
MGLWNAWGDGGDEAGRVVRDSQGNNAQLVRPVDTFYNNIAPREVQYYWERQGTDVKWAGLVAGQIRIIFMYRVPDNQTFLLSHLVFRFSAYATGNYAHGYAPDDYVVNAMRYKLLVNRVQPWSAGSLGAEGFDLLNQNIMEMYGNSSTLAIAQGSEVSVVVEIWDDTIEYPTTIMMSAEVGGRLIPTSRWESVQV